MSPYVPKKITHSWILTKMSRWLLTVQWILIQLPLHFSGPSIILMSSRIDVIPFRYTIGRIILQLLSGPLCNFQMNSSRLNYTPTSGVKFETLSCYARNTVGLQKNPCVFHIGAVARPSSLQNCTTSHLSPDYSLQVECLESFDGGVSHGFLLELVEVPTMRLVRNMSLQVRVL